MPISSKVRLSGGAVILGFGIGLEFKLKDIFRPTSFVLALFRIGVPGLGGYSLGWAFESEGHRAGWIGGARTTTRVTGTADTFNATGKRQTETAPAILGPRSSIVPGKLDASAEKPARVIEPAVANGRRFKRPKPANRSREGRGIGNGHRPEVDEGRDSTDLPRPFFKGLQFPAKQVLAILLGARHKVVETGDLVLEGFLCSKAEKPVKETGGRSGNSASRVKFPPREWT